MPGTTGLVELHLP